MSPTAKAQLVRRAIEQQLPITKYHLSRNFFPDQSNKTDVEIFSQIFKKNHERYSKCARRLIANSVQKNVKNF